MEYLQQFLNILNSYSGKPNNLNLYIQKNYLDLYNKIEENSKFYTERRPPFGVKCCWLVFGINNYPICPVCGKENHRIPPNKNIKQFLENKNYLLYCSKKCFEIGEGIRDKMIQTSIEKYGTKYPAQSKIVQGKMRKTSIDRYGEEGLKNEKIRNKKKQTCLEKYGVEYSAQAKEVKDKINDTFSKKYGGRPLTCEEIKSKFKQTCIERYGSDNYTKTEEGKERIRKIMVDLKENHPELYNDIKIKTKQTLIERYGVDSATKIPSAIEMSKKKILEKYGVEYTFQAKEVKDKIKQTLIERYGVDNVSRNKEIHEKQTISIIKKKRQQSYDIFIKNNEYVELLSDRETYIDDINQKLKWKCKKCGHVFISEKDTNFHSVARCPICYPRNYFGQEKDLFDFISKFGNFEILRNDRQTISPKELDIYIPSKKLAIEFDGLYWHSTQMNCNTSYHLQKTKLCESKGIQLIHIFEDEWNSKQDIVKDRIKSILGIYDTKIGARQCEIRIVSNSECKEFLNNNHMQGYIPANINFGLFYNNELVSLMTFGSYRKSLGSEKKENEYEMYRFCNKLGYHISGGASKLLKKFEELVKPKKLISYCDRRWSQGKLYKSIGFQLIKETQPNYFYVIDQRRENRFKYRKSQLSTLLKNFDPELSEEENMKNNNYYKIYDCGNYLFEKNY